MLLKLFLYSIVLILTFALVLQIKPGQDFVLGYFKDVPDFISLFLGAEYALSHNPLSNALNIELL